MILLEQYRSLSHPSYLKQLHLKGGVAMEVSVALTLMVSFGTLIAFVMSGQNKK